MSEVDDGVFRIDGVKDVVLEHNGNKYPLKIKEMSWSEMNKTLSECTAYTADKKGSFDIDAYYRAALIKMVLDSPWGAFKHETIVRFTPEFGAKLEALVPLPGGSGARPFSSGSPISTEKLET